MVNSVKQENYSGRLVLFDFDGTITTSDTFIDFIKFANGRFKFYTGFIVLSPILILYKLKLIKNWRAKEMVFSYYFKGMPADTFQQLGKRFASEKLPGLLKVTALEKLQEHIASRDRVYIVTASSAVWIAPWCEQFGIPVLDTKWAVEQGRITGKIEGKNCYGPEKAVRIQSMIPVQQFSTVIAYGDTRGDREMLDLAHEKNYRVFNK